MHESILVSVIIPVFNVASYLVESINSVVNQTYKHLEIIIIDDGSTDESGKICDEYKEKDKRIRVIHQQNKGLSAARNKGLELATGDAVAFLDSDDSFHPRFVQDMVQNMIRENAEMVISKYTLSHSTGQIKEDVRSQKYPPIRQGEYNRIDALRALANKQINPSVWNKLYKRALWKTERFPEGQVYEDVDTTYRIMNMCNKVCVLDQPLYYCRLRPNRITAPFTKKHLEDYLRACTHFESFIIQHIPEIFSSQQLIIRMQARLSMMILFCFRLIQNGYETKEYYKNLRKQIISLRNEVGFGDCKLRIKIAYYFILTSPRIIQMLYRIYG